MNQDTAPTADRIRVMIVDDHELVRSGLQSILRLYVDIELVARPTAARAPWLRVPRPRLTWCSWTWSCRA